MNTYSSSAAYGSGGLGRVFAEMIEASRAEGVLLRYYSSKVCPADANGIGVVVNSRLLPYLTRFTPARFNSGLKQFLAFDLFDRAVSKRIGGGAYRHVGFCGQSLHTFRAARRAGYSVLELIAPTCHLKYVARQHALARNQYPIEIDWLNGAHIRKALAEYSLADRIYVVSEYVRQSFIENGVDPARLMRIKLAAEPRFRPTARRVSDGVFRIVYTGALSVVKGVPLLLDAFRDARLEHAELTLVGSTGSRGMKHFVAARCAADSRIKIEPGDPLPHLQRADLYVHPSYQDGFPYAVLEAMACGVPVISTGDTGTKELLREGENGWIIPTGDRDALVAAIENAMRRIQGQ